MIAAALRRWLEGRAYELIGPPSCPIMARWEAKLLGLKLVVHYFFPHADDRDPHDHPRSFATLVVAGSYVDLSPGRPPDRLRRGSVRFRSAAHRHITRAGPTGAWTLVAMGPQRREWGFWRSGRWWQWRDYERTFGFAMRCE